MRSRQRVIRTTAVAVVAALCMAGAASAAAKLPKPGTAAQITTLVAASSSIQTLPKKPLPSLTSAATDTAGAYYGVAGRECDGVTKCVFGNTRSKTL